MFRNFNSSVIVLQNLLMPSQNVFPGSKPIVVVSLMCAMVIWFFVHSSGVHVFSILFSFSFVRLWAA